MSEFYDQVQEIDQRVSDLENTSLNQDVNYDTMTNLTDFMRGIFWEFGTVTLSSGVAVVTIPNCSSASIVTISSGSPKVISVDKSVSGQLTFQSTDLTDAHIVDYFVIFNT